MSLSPAGASSGRERPAAPVDGLDDPPRGRTGFTARLLRWLDHEARLAAAERRRGLGVLVGTVRRFVVIEGWDLAGLISLELFLTVVPITILGYATLAPQRAGSSIGKLYVRQLHLSGANAQLVMQTFGDASAVRSAFGSIWGWLGFLVWGIPMALTVAKVFAKAWKLPEPGMLTQLWRGACWFVLYLLATFSSDFVQVATRHLTRVSWFNVLVGLALALVPLVVLWAASHPLLVPGARWHWGTMLVIGLAGALLNGPVLRFAEVPAFPLLMSWWTGFGPLGVAMTLLIWSLVQGVGWVLAACLGAVIVERRRPIGQDGHLLPLEEALAIDAGEEPPLAPEPAGGAHVPPHEPGPR